MGFDLFGKNPVDKTGEYFRNNVWWWRPLWEYVEKHCCNILSVKDQQLGRSNDGHLINKQKAQCIAICLRKLVESGEIKKYADEYMTRIEKIPNIVCVYCSGTGIRTDHIGVEREMPTKIVTADNKRKGQVGWCSGCRGSGKTEPIEKWYTFDEDNVKDFIAFCGSSGGFTIC